MDETPNQHEEKVLSRLFEEATRMHETRLYHHGQVDALLVVEKWLTAEMTVPVLRKLIHNYLVELKERAEKA